MPITEDIVKIAYDALKEFEIIEYIDNEYSISENYDNKISDFLTMLYFYNLPLVVWNFENGRYTTEINTSKAVLKVAVTEELLRYYCPNCNKINCNRSCELVDPVYSSLRHFVETKDTLGQRWLAIELIETALTVLKKATTAFKQADPTYEDKKSRLLPRTSCLSPYIYFKKVHLGQFYYQNYYPKSFDDLDRCDTGYFNNQNEFLTKLNLNTYIPEIKSLINDQKLKHKSHPSNHFSFIATTSGDGFLCGAGIPHDFGFPRPQPQNQHRNEKGELLLGMYFDHTTGLPVLPGETFKGVLRSIFEEKPEIVIEISNELKIKKQNGELINSDDIAHLLIEIFDNPIQKDNQSETFIRDEFITCFPIESNNTGGRFLGIDTITAHDENPLKSPKASIPFLKVLTNIDYQFNIILTDGIISKNDKLKLIKYLISEFGLGAKSRRGFGKFKFKTDIVLND